jgi:hypothetical protein
MELEELKNAWQQMSKRVEHQEFLTNQLLEKMTREKYNSKINKIGYSEYFGAIICYIGAAYLIINFIKIDNSLMQIFAIIVIALLFILPIISLKSLRAIKNVNITSKTYMQAIEDFEKRKTRFQRLQKLNVSLALFLMLVAIPVLLAIQGKDIDQIPNFWLLIFPISNAFLLVFAVWVLKSYNKILNETGKMLSDINN